MCVFVACWQKKSLKWAEIIETHENHNRIIVKNNKEKHVFNGFSHSRV